MQPQLEVEYTPEYKLSTVQAQYSTDSVQYRSRAVHSHTWQDVLFMVQA